MMVQSNIIFTTKDFVFLNIKSVTIRLSYNRGKYHVKQHHDSEKNGGSRRIRSITN